MPAMFKQSPKFEVVDDAMADVLRGKTERERLEISFGMWRFARDMIRENLKSDHLHWTDEQINKEVARRLSHGAV